MKKIHLLIALMLFVALLLAGCGANETPPLAVPEGAQAGDLVGLKGCEFQPADSQTKYTAECGTLVVPENRGVAGSRLIALPIVRIPASGANPAEPVFYLQGGPGQSNFSWPPYFYLRVIQHMFMSAGAEAARPASRAAVFAASLCCLLPAALMTVFPGWLLERL